MDVGESLAIAVAASALGGFAGSWYTTHRQISHEREENLRSRMLDAADDFSLKVTRTLNRLQEVVQIVPEEDLYDEEGHIDPELPETIALVEAARQLRSHTDEVRTGLPRVHLLFGQESQAGQAASQVVGLLWFATEALIEECVVNLAHRKFLEAATTHATFTKEARKALLSPTLADDQKTTNPSRADGDREGPPPW